MKSLRRSAVPMRGWHAKHRSRWSLWLSVYVLLSVAWPSTGALPWMMLDLPEEAHLVAGFDHDHEGTAAHAHHHDADVPGSPTHPIDHDCAQCQVLKHLARCVLPDPVVASVPSLAGDAVLACTEPAPRYASFTTERPPIRGPPLSA